MDRVASSVSRSLRLKLLQVNVSTLISMPFQGNAANTPRNLFRGKRFDLRTDQVLSIYSYKIVEEICFSVASIYSVYPVGKVKLLSTEFECCSRPHPHRGLKPLQIARAATTPFPCYPHARSCF